VEDFKDTLKHGGTLDEATTLVFERHSATLRDSDDGPLVWLALGHCQWTYGGSADADVLDRILADLSRGAGLERWADESPAVLKKRRDRMAAFIEKIREPNPKPSKFPKLIVRKPVFEQGDCLSILLDDGRYGAAVVLAADHSQPEYGRNLIGVLDWVGDAPPKAKTFRTVFGRRKWLRLTHHNWSGSLDVSWYTATRFRSFKDRVAVVDKTEITKKDPLSATSHSPWVRLGQQVLLQREWDATPGKQRN
jgi:hypothetical protein